MNTDFNLMLIFTGLLAVAVLLIICFILCLVCLFRVQKVKKNTKNVLTEEALLQYIDKIREKNSDSAISDPHAFCKSAIVNFNAYDDVTGNFSFSLALLDSFNSGFVITSLYGHNSCNTYIRKILRGNCETFLLDEEKQAIDAAIDRKE